MAVRSFSNSICRAWQQARSVWESEFPSEESDQLQDLHELGMKCIWWLYLKYVNQLSTIVNLLSAYLCGCNDTSVADTVGSFCLSEPNSGSDAFALKTKAVPGQMPQTKSFVEICRRYTYRQTDIHPPIHPSMHAYIHTLHYTPLHCTALHYITLRYITLHYIHTYIHTLHTVHTLHTLHT